MPLEILAPFVVLAVAVIMLVISRSGLSRSATLTDSDAITRRFQIDHPEVEVRSVWIDNSQKTALLTLSAEPLPSGALGLVKAVGDRTTTRLLLPGSLKSVAEQSDGLHLHSADFTWPRHTVKLKDPDDRAQWLTLLRPLAAGTETPTSRRSEPIGEQGS